MSVGRAQRLRSSHDPHQRDDRQADGPDSAAHARRDPAAGPSGDDGRRGGAAGRPLGGDGGADRPQPTVLVRSPYGRTQFIGLLYGRLLAERGLQVVIQSVRGTFGSGGEFSPFDERADGLATLRWIREQPWHADRIGMLGPELPRSRAVGGGAGRGRRPGGAGDPGQRVAVPRPDVCRRQPLVGDRRHHGWCWSPSRSAGWPRWRSPARCAACRPCWTSCRSASSTSWLPAPRSAGFARRWPSPARDDSYWVTRDYAAGVGKVRRRCS